MSKRAEKAIEAYYGNIPDDADKVKAARHFYEQAEKDIISHIREQIERWMPKDNGEEHIKGERTAFNSVLHLLKEMKESNE